MVDMLSITPYRKMLNDRFPVASFSVHVPPHRVFEIACATEPELFRGDHRAQRTPENFFTSRSGGLLRAPAGQATYLLPPEQLRRFAGKRRLYYAIASYGDATGASPELTASPGDPTMPYVAISPDFSGRALQRPGLRRHETSDRYGGPAPLLTWGGDSIQPPQPASAPVQAPAKVPYDDGYPADLWSRGQDANDPRDPSDPPDPEPVSFGGEPPGYEDAPALRAYEQAEAYGRRSYGRGMPNPTPSTPATNPLAERESPGNEQRPRIASVRTPIAEPPGAADPSELRGGSGAYGAVAAATQPATKQAAPKHRSASPRSTEASAAALEVAPFIPPGVDDQYDASEDVEGELPMDDSVGPESLTIVDKFRLAQPTARFESGDEGYSCINADGEFNDPTHAAYRRKHYGLHWGLMQANQRSGSLGRILVACERRNPVRFREAFGPGRDELIRVTTAPTEEARLQPVQGSPLWQEPWISRFRAAGKVPEFQAAQNEEAIEGYFDTNLPFAAAIGFNSDRALAMLYDRCVDMGNAGGRRFIAQAVTPAKDDATLQKVLQALKQDSVQSFLRSSGLPESTTLGPKGHAALIAALRAVPQSPVPVMTLEQMFDAIVAASKGRRFERRVQELRSSTQLSDTPRQVS
jgi:hypothetical protein